MSGFVSSFASGLKQEKALPASAHPSSPPPSCVKRRIRRLARALRGRRDALVAWPLLSVAGSSCRCAVPQGIAALGSRERRTNICIGILL